MLSTRRNFLLAALGIAWAAVVAACGGVARQASGSAAPSQVIASEAPVPIDTPTCVVTPAETEGPYFVDERLNRSDIRSDPADSSVRPGVPLALALTVGRMGTGGCTAFSGAQVDVWHCDALGSYSDVSAENTTGRKYLRGYQMTDASGVARFTTIFPGWYRGRAVHIHFKVRTFSGSQKKLEFTSQIFFDDAMIDHIYANAPYSSRAARDTRNSNDMVYSSNNNSGAGLMAKLTAASGGYTATFSVGLNA